MIDIIQSIWLHLFYQPIYNLVIITYNLSPGPSFGLTIIGLAILIRFIFLYFTLLGYKHDQQLIEVKPLINMIESDQTLSGREKIEKVSAILKPHGIDPFLVSIPLFAQVIFLGVLYQIIQIGINSNGFHNLYSFVGRPSSINIMFLGINMAKSSLILAFAAAIFLFIERFLEYNEHKDIVRSTLSQRWDPLIWPAGTFIILLLLPSAKAVFLITSVAFSLSIKSIFHLTKR